MTVAGTATSPMHAVIARFLIAHPECRLRALGARDNAAALELLPFGHRIDYLDAATERVWVERYWQANLARFPGPVALPRWVLCDLYLMPAAIGLLTCPARELPDALRPTGTADGDEAIAAAYYAAPAVTPGMVIGVSALSVRPGIGAGAIIKAVTLGMLRARVQRGITQWSSQSLRAVHTRMGIVRVVGHAVGHALESESFVYAVDLHDELAWSRALERRAPDAAPGLPPGVRWVAVSDAAALAELRERAARGERIEILPPGLSADGGALLIRA